MNDTHFSPWQRFFAQMFFWAAPLIFLAAVSTASADPSQEKHKHVEMGASSKINEAMKNGDQQMESLPITGNVDEDFVRMMIPHHQTAIEAARIQLKEGKDPEIKKMAQKNIRSQEQDVAKLQAWLKKKRNPTG